MRASALGKFSGPARVVVLGTSQNDVNLRTLLGPLGFPVQITVRIPSGVVIGSTSTGNAALQSGSGWASGTVIRLENSGKIQGKGGAGGGGGSVASNVPSVTGTAAVAGSPGGHAIETTVPITIDNASGEIFGGGGGGGGGAGEYAEVEEAGMIVIGGSGGGGGQGYGTSAAGAAGTGDEATGYVVFEGPGNAGNTGSASAAGSGGAAATGGGGSYASGAGGSGGGWGSSGATGDAAFAAGNGTAAAAAGGAGGNAVKLNGNSITWVAGNNASQVKGAVS